MKIRIWAVGMMLMVGGGVVAQDRLAGSLSFDVGTSVTTNFGGQPWVLKAIYVDYRNTVGFSNVFTVARVRGTDTNTLFSASHTNLSDAIKFLETHVQILPGDFVFVSNSEAGLTNGVALDRQVP